MLIRRLLHLYLLPWSISSVEGSTLTNHLAPRDYNSSHVEKYVGYVKDPNGRGTISLVLSCLLTLVLCVWSALHLNVPERNRKGITTIWINFRWILAGIYSPEMVVFAAWRQWCSARMLNGHIQSLLEEQDAGRHDSNAAGSAKGPQQCTVTWSMTHSFFANSGGFAVELQALSGVLVTDTDDSPATDHENVRPARLTLTARGMMLLANSGHLPVVEKAGIEDKSKANDLAKAAVIVQATCPELETLRLLVPRRNKQSAQEPPHEQILPQGAVQRAPEACLTKTEESRQKDAASAFCGALWVILNSAVARWSALNSFWEKWMDGKKSLLQSVGLGAVVFVCGSSLCLARAFIVVEAFMSIRELPVTAYATPEWSDVFPHF